MDYLEGFQYANGTLLFFPTAEGYVSHASGQFNHVYNYTDHLGNIRLSYGTDPQTGDLRIIEENHYYPFGLKHASYNVDRLEYQGETGGVILGPIPFNPKVKFGYGYKYNGKEFQDELGLNMYAMDMRQYDPAIARWVVQDPVVHHSVSPYNAFDNNPVFWADPSGADSQTLYDFNGNAHTVNDSEMVNLWKSSQANDNSIAEIFDYFGTSHISDGDFDGGGETDHQRKDLGH